MRSWRTRSSSEELQPWSSAKSFLSSPTKKTIPETSPGVCQHLGVSLFNCRSLLTAKLVALKDSKASPQWELRDPVVLPGLSYDCSVPHFQQYLRWGSWADATEPDSQLLDFPAPRGAGDQGESHQRTLRLRRDLVKGGDVPKSQRSRVQHRGSLPASTRAECVGNGGVTCPWLKRCTQFLFPACNSGSYKCL